MPEASSAPLPQEGLVGCCWCWCCRSPDVPLVSACWSAQHFDECVTNTHRRGLVVRAGRCTGVTCVMGSARLMPAARFISPTTGKQKKQTHHPSTPGPREFKNLPWASKEKRAGVKYRQTPNAQPPPPLPVYSTRSPRPQFVHFSSPAATTTPARSATHEAPHRPLMPRLPATRECR